MSQGKGLNGGAAGTTPKNGTDNHLCTPRLERGKCLFNLAVSAPPAGMVKVKKRRRKLSQGAKKPGPDSSWAPCDYA